MFMAEPPHAIFTVVDSPPIVDDLGYHVEVRAAVDNAAKTIRILEVKQLSFDGAACARPRKK